MSGRTACLAPFLAVLPTQADNLMEDSVEGMK